VDNSCPNLINIGPIASKYFLTLMPGFVP